MCCVLARSIVEKADLSHDRGGLAFLLLAAFLAALYMIPVFSFGRTSRHPVTEVEEACWVCVLLLYSAQHQQPASISSVSSTAQRYEAENLFLHKEHDQSKSIPLTNPILITIRCRSRRRCYLHSTCYATCNIQDFPTRHRSYMNKMGHNIFSSFFACEDVCIITFSGTGCTKPRASSASPWQWGRKP